MIASADDLGACLVRGNDMQPDGIRTCWKRRVNPYLRLLAVVAEDDFRRQVDPLSPLGWHLGHIGVVESF
jgi:hypothetical protein